MKTLDLRPATIEDVDEIVDLINMCYRGDSSRAGWTTEADLLGGTRTHDKEIRDLISQPGSMILVCISDRELVGSVHIQQDGDASYLGLLAVQPNRQDGGVGRQLIKAAEDHARDSWGSTRMTMSVITVRPELLAYYERRGYRRTGKMKPFAYDESHGIPSVDGIMLEILEKELV
jgi:ribosomal protein S18 acetylase RimI-like enzyme